MFWWVGVTMKMVLLLSNHGYLIYTNCVLNDSTRSYIGIHFNRWTLHFTLGHIPVILAKIYSSKI